MNESEKLLREMAMEKIARMDKKLKDKLWESAVVETFTQLVDNIKYRISRSTDMPFK